MDRDTEVMRQRAEAQLREWRGRLQTWQAKIDQQRLEAADEGRKTVEHLRRRADEMGERLKELEVQGRDTSGELRRRVDSTWKDLEEGFQKARQRFDA